ncbi:MAG TPA: hypothetical protein VGH20_11110 [Myxococcales bacterium]
MKLIGIVVLACACAHGPADKSLRRLPIRVADGVLATPLSTAPRAQLWRDALLLALVDHGYCVDRTGDFEAWLHVKSEVEEGGVDVVTLTIDNGSGSEIDEVSERLPSLPESMEDARRGVEPLLRDMASSGALRELAASARPGPCAPAPP